MGHAPCLRDLGVFMKKLFGKIRFTRKMLWIFIGICVVCNATGAAAVFIGRDRLIGPSYADVNGMSCTEVQSVDIHRKDQIWVRKYVTVDQADGANRIRTALRVAKAVADSRKVDLVQVVVLDKNGPTDRAGIRGRAIGADVVYIRNAAALPAGVKRPALTARYVDGMANSSGEFFGTSVSVPTGNAADIMNKMTDKADCTKPVGAEPEAKAHKAEGAKPKKEADSHGKEEAAAKEGESAKVEAKPEAKPAEGHVAEAAPAAEKPGMFASLKGMIFGAEEKPATDAHGDAKPGADAHGDAKAPAQKPEEASKPVAVDAPKQAVVVEPPAETVAELEPIEDKSVLSAVKSLVFGAKKPTTDEKPAATQEKSH